MLVWHGYDVLLHSDDSIYLNACTDYQVIPPTLLYEPQLTSPDFTYILFDAASLFYSKVLTIDTNL